jgi:hypothetical protein
VAGILKLDDIGAGLAKTPGDNPLSKAARTAGKLITRAAPAFIKTVGVLGTVAMFTVGGGMLVHGIPGASALLAGGLKALPGGLASMPVVGDLVTMAAEAVFGVAAGIITQPAGKVLWPMLKKAGELAAKLKQKIRPSAPQPDDGEDEMPAPAPVPAPQKPALQNIPDVKTDLNTAAPPPVTPVQIPTVTVLPKQNAKPVEDKPAVANDTQDAKAQPAAKKKGP